MKKILSALTAAALLCGMTAMPVSADVNGYKMGDVNMDGYIGADDAQLVLRDYLNCMLILAPERRVLTEEQIALGNVDLQMRSYEFIRLDGSRVYAESELTGEDAQIIMCYYVESLADPSIQEIDIVDWAKQMNPSIYAGL